MADRFFVVGYYGFGNAGDDAIGIATVSHLQSTIESAEVSTVSGGRLVFSDNDVRVVDFSMWAILREIRVADKVILTGGSHFHDQYTRFIDGIKVFAFYLTLVLVAKALGKTVYLLGHGIGPLWNRIYRTLTVIIICISDSVTVRDPQSQESVSCRWTDIELTFDIGALLHSHHVTTPEQKTMLGVSITPAFAKDYDEPQRDEKLTTKLSSAINDIGRNGDIDAVRIFTFHTGDFNDDVEFSMKFDNKLEVSDVQIVHYDDDPAAFISQVSQADLFVGMKYHSLVFSYLNQIPTAAISYHPKCKWFRDYVGYEEKTTVKMEEVAEESTAQELLSRLVANPDSFRAQMSTSKAKTLAKHNFTKFQTHE